MGRRRPVLTKNDVGDRAADAFEASTSRYGLAAERRDLTHDVTRYSDTHEPARLCLFGVQARVCYPIDNRRGEGEWELYFTLSHIAASSPIVCTASV